MVHKVYVVVRPTDVGDLESPIHANGVAIRFAKQLLVEHDKDPDQFTYRAQFIGFWGPHPDSSIAQFEVLATAKRDDLAV